MIGKTISHYKILEKLGEGGMGVVYKAEDTKLERTVALKFLSTQYTSDPEIVERFKREAKAAAALNHPNIITVYEIGEHEGQTFIAMEHIKGESLRDRMKRALSPEDTLELISQVCRGLSKAQQADIVHRDIKPENIMIDEDGRVRILDFGLAKLKNVSKLTQTATTLGTLNYMSPEQLQGMEVDHRADIFSLGILLYEMITAELPFEGEYEAAVVYSIVHEDPKPLSFYKNDIPEYLDRIIDRALQKQPAMRYQNVADMLADLKARENADSTKTKAVKIKKSKPARRVVVAVLLVVVALLAIFIIKLSQRQVETPVAVRHRQVTFDGNVDAPDLGGYYMDVSGLSPDGQSVAYVVPKDTLKSLMVRDLSGGEPLEIFGGQMNTAFLRWSAAGSQILWGGIFGKDDSFNARNNYLIPRFGGRPRTLPPTSVGSWSPDGSQVAGIWAPYQYIIYFDIATADSVGNIQLGGFHWFLDLDWSPVGERIVFLSSDKLDKQCTIWTVKTDGSQQQKILQEIGRYYSPRWSHDGSTIYYLRQNGQTQDLMKIKISSEDGAPRGEPKTLQTGLHAFGFTLSRDNKKLTYTKILTHSNLWLMSLIDEGGAQKEETKMLTRGSSRFNWPSLSPDGKEIAFASQGQIFVMPSGGGEMQQLTFLKSESFAPCWSPNGTELAFNSGGKIWRISAKGGTPRPFAETDASDGLTAWHPGEEILYQRPGNQNFAILNPETEIERPLVANSSAGWIFNPRYSPDGKRVAVLWNRLIGEVGQGPGLWVVSLEDSSQTFLQHDMFEPIQWSINGKWIYAWKQGGGSPISIWMIPVDGGEPEELVTLPFEKIPPYSGISMTQDGKRIVCSVDQKISDVWLIENFDPDVR